MPDLTPEDSLRVMAELQAVSLRAMLALNVGHDLARALRALVDYHSQGEAIPVPLARLVDEAEAVLGRWDAR